MQQGNTRAGRRVVAALTTGAAALLLLAGGCAQRQGEVVDAGRGAGTMDLLNVEGLSPVHREMLERKWAQDPAQDPPAVCFAPGTPDRVVELFNANPFFSSPAPGQEFQNNGRWSSTALQPAGSPLGESITLTWSIVPDGTPISGFNGEPANPSDLRARLNTIYGSEAVWLPLFQGIFDRWSQLSGVKYVYQPTDDGAAVGTVAGVAGVRGDVRISGHLIDGNSGILAYNFFPNNGDMVIDTGDNFFDDVSANSIRFRNVVAHEHGHGLGMSHVCPITQSKLMEPFAATNFDGPRHDDLRHIQYLYGDPYEPNNNAAQATDLGNFGAAGSALLGAIPAPTVPSSALLSIDNPGEQDWFKVTVSGPSLLSVQVAPVGTSYDDSAQACSGQTGSCCSGNVINSTAQMDLTLAAFGTDGVTQLGSSNSNGLGTSEALLNVGLPGAGTYFFRVGEATGSGRSQLYSLNVSTQPSSMTVVVLNGAETNIAPGAPASIDVQITPGNQQVNQSASALFYRVGTGAFSSVPLTPLGSNNYRASIPLVDCTAGFQFYVRAVGTGGAVVSSPSNAPTSVYSPFVGTITTILDDDFEIDRGWTTGPNTANSSGFWTRVDPVGTIAQPEDDHTPAPGTICWVTGQGTVGGAAGANDVDNGQVILNSPNLNMAGQNDATISYWRWYSNGAGAGPYNDVFRVQVSTNGGTTWNAAETIGPGSTTDPNTNGGWVFASWTLSSLGLTPTANVRVRFIAEDANPQSLLEAALDDFKAVARACNFTAPSCLTDYNRDTFANLDDLGDFITDYYYTPAIPGGLQPNAPTLSNIPNPGYGVPCPSAPNAPSPYAVDAYRTNGYRVGFSGDGSNACPISPDAAFPNLDNLGDFITAYYATSC